MITTLHYPDTPKQAQWGTLAMPRYFVDNNLLYVDFDTAVK
ncbi:hypothetical protein DYBT9275_00508 [Dyadobacter sp. CECT 9275]|uniref:Uncharacterized protein n=1 Tax=Dyadobacter helix TaxID=2822344 RepID=A0A916J8I5_9BACT|nr:hypothetical protein [Dyadobacter sp. CECT 9275]CAG4990348.1 hypothetical protein DYBT9275_00508 [Dyadobacter sp. CECT 9275]